MGEATAIPDLGNVGLVNPLGEGLVIDLPAELVDVWRAEAGAQIDRPEMELGWRESDGLAYDRFCDELRSSISSSEVAKAQITMHAIGTVMVWLEFATPVPPERMHAFAVCFEFAGYLPAVSEQLLALAVGRCRPLIEGPSRSLVQLTNRERPEASVDASGYVESRIFSYFVRMALCVDEGDDQALERLFDRFPCRVDPLRFEYHGSLYAGSAYAVVARSIEQSQGQPVGEAEDPRGEIERMLVAARIAQLFLGTCEALSTLFRVEMDRQVEGYVKGGTQARSASDLNRLRTLALAVVTTTDLTMVTPTDEDQEYFRRFADEAQLDRLRASIQSSCEILYNVQAAEEQYQADQRSSRLSSFFAFLTALTLLSVLVDAYGYVREDDPLVVSRIIRSLTLVVLFCLVTVVFANRWGLRASSRHRPDP